MVSTASNLDIFLSVSYLEEGDCRNIPDDSEDNGIGSL
jgi:hypothetical protein